MYCETSLQNQCTHTTGTATLTAPPAQAALSTQTDRVSDVLHLATYTYVNQLLFGNMYTMFHKNLNVAVISIIISLITQGEFDVQLKKLEGIHTWLNIYTWSNLRTVWEEASEKHVCFHTGKMNLNHGSIVYTVYIKAFYRLHWRPQPFLKLERGSNVKSSANHIILCLASKVTHFHMIC